MPHVRSCDRESLLAWMAQEGRPAPTDPSYVPESVWAEFLRARIVQSDKETVTDA